MPGGLPAKETGLAGVLKGKLDSLKKKVTERVAALASPTEPVGSDSTLFDQLRSESRALRAQHASLKKSCRWRHWASHGR